MAFRGTASRLLAGAGILVVGGLAAGCQSKDALGSVETPAKPKITQGELLAFCPPIGLRQGTAFFTTYEKAAPARPAKKAAAAEAPEDTAFTDKPAQRVVYQTSITDVTRSCTRANGILTMKVAVAGKVVPGPAARLGTVQLPLRIAITTGDQVLFSQLFQYSAQVAVPQAGIGLRPAGEADRPHAGGTRGRNAGRGSLHHEALVRVRIHRLGRVKQQVGRRLAFQAEGSGGKHRLRHERLEARLLQHRIEKLRRLVRDHAASRRAAERLARALHRLRFALQPPLHPRLHLRQQRGLERHAGLFLQPQQYVLEGKPAEILDQVLGGQAGARQRFGARFRDHPLSINQHAPKCENHEIGHRLASSCHALRRHFGQGASPFNQAHFIKFLR